MIKGKDFWKCLCGELDYRFFAGVICEGLKPLYTKMNTDFMYYIPTINEDIALGIVSGANLSGVKGGVLMDIKNIYSIYDWFVRFNLKYKVSFLIIAYDDGVNQDYKKLFKENMFISENFYNDLKKFIKVMERKSVPGLLVVSEGDLI